MGDPLVFKVLTGGTLLVTTIFIALFAREPWLRARFGQSVMVLSIGLWLFALTSTLRNWLGDDYAGRNAVRVGAQSLTLVAMLIRTVVLARAQWRERKRR